MNEITRMQENLLLIRQVAGWTAESLGERIGVTRQTINNIENGRNKLTKTLYIALRYVLEQEIISRPQETEMLSILLNVIIDEPDRYSNDIREKLIRQAKLTAPAILSGSLPRTEVSSEYAETFRQEVGSVSIETETAVLTQDEGTQEKEHKADANIGVNNTNTRGIASTIGAAAAVGVIAPVVGLASTIALSSIPIATIGASTEKMLKINSSIWKKITKLPEEKNKK